MPSTHEAPTASPLLQAQASLTATTTWAHSKPSKLTKLRSASSFLAKLSSPLTALNKLRPPRGARKQVSEFYIRLNEPHREYSPSDLVRGSVILTTEKDIRVTHLVVNLVGRVDLYGVATYNVGKKKTVNYAGPVEFEGGVILCRDQQVLCGEGRLEAGVYEFGFVMELTGKRLPSSLNFEKGSISYNISATLTRPTTISPTRMCEHKLNLVELIDIASYAPPKPRIILLESGTKRGRIKSSHGSCDEKANAKAMAAAAVGRKGSSSGPTTPNSSAPHIAIDTANVKTAATKFKNAEVTATIELLKAGCLRGESIPLKIQINHVKPIKSLHGVIVTLVRQGRFDTFPISAGRLNTKSSSSSLKKGLSLGSGGSTTTFRKDLSQVILPLIVDPTTLMTVVRASVRVPEDAFPTINNVPGGIVSFRYFVEVLVDLGGKLAGKEEFLSGVGMVNIPGAANGEFAGVEGGKLGLGGEGGLGMMAVYGAKVVETEKIRREVKNVVSCRFEVIVGTTDSARGKGRRSRTCMSRGGREFEESGDSGDGCEDGMGSGREVGQERTSHPGYDHSPTRNMLRMIVVPGALNVTGHQQAPPSPPAHVFPISLPPIPGSLEKGGMQMGVPLPPPPPLPLMEADEKTRLRIAEQALLPSEPPGFEDGGAGLPGQGSSLMEEPSMAGLPPAPMYGAYEGSVSAPMLDQVPMTSEYTVPPSAPLLEEMEGAALGIGMGGVGEGSSNARYHYHHQGYYHYQPQYSPPSHTQTESQQVQGEDKLELERRRLLAEASAPPLPSMAPGIEVGDGPGLGMGMVSAAPSAPVLNEAAEVEAVKGVEGLPRYER
ncbi:hypothetical protein BDZ91DRAFT_801944 [Kalaharituber pfeilii]|nr:hypothetical protein BDZ91DRAFT_801944 [Kalaharituber pfeilii]